MTRHPSRGDASVARTSVIWITDPLASQFWSSDVRPALVAGVPSAPAPTTYGAAPTAALPLNGMTEAIAETGSRRPPTDESEDARPGPPEPRADNGSAAVSRERIGGPAAAPWSLDVGLWLKPSREVGRARFPSEGPLLARGATAARRSHPQSRPVRGAATALCQGRRDRAVHTEQDGPRGPGPRNRRAPVSGPRKPDAESSGSTIENRIQRPRRKRDRLDSGLIAVRVPAEPRSPAHRLNSLEAQQSAACGASCPGPERSRDADPLTGG